MCALRCAHAVWREDGTTVSPNILTEKVRQSLPQGLPVAPLIAEIIISKLVWKNPPGVKLINFMDNFILLGKSEAAVIEAANTLSAAVSALAGGSFSLKPAPVVHTTAGAEFLGHDFQMVDGQLLVRPSLSAVNECARMMEHYEEELSTLFSYQKELLVPMEDVLIVAGKMRAYLTSWAAAFSECDEMEEWKAAFAITMQECLGVLGVSDEKIKAYYDADAEFIWHGYSES